MAEAGWPLVGRDEELDLLTATLETGGSVVIAGGSGVGKSRLAADFLDRAAQDGRRTALARATRSTATIPFGPFVSWAPGQRGGSPDRLTVLRAIGRQLVTGDERVLVVVDDAHWLDDGSAALVLHLVTETSASVLVTVRTGEPCPDAVESLWKEGVAERVDLQPLSEVQTADLAENVLGAPVDRTARRRLFTLTEGLPLYLREVVRAGLEQNVLVLDDGVWRWHGRLAGSDRLVGLIRAHMARTDEAERRVIHLVALGEPVPVELVRRLAPPQALIAAEVDGFVAVDRSERPPVVRLAHPLYGELLRDQMPALTAHDYQRDLASAAVAYGWHVRHPLQVASWWLGSGATTGNPDLLLSAATRAQMLAEWDLSDRLAEGAAASGAGPRARLIRAAALVPTGRFDEAEAVLAELISGDVDEQVIADAVSIRASLLFWRRGRAEEARQALADAAGRLSGGAHAHVMAIWSWLTLFAGDAEEAAQLATAALAEPDADPELRVHALASAAMAWAFTGRTSQALAAAEEAQPHVAAVLASSPHPTYPAALVLPAQCYALILQGRLDDAAALADADLARLMDREEKVLRAAACALAGFVALRQGRVDRALQLGRDGLELNREADQDPGNGWPAAMYATAAAQAGDLSGEAVLDRVASAGPVPPMTAVDMKLARAWLAAARGELSAAHAIAAQAAVDAATFAPACELFALVDLARLGAPERAVSRLRELADVIDGDYAPTVATFAAALAADDGKALDDASIDLARMGAVALAAEAAAAAAKAHVRAGRRGSHLASLARARALAVACGSPRTPGLRDLDAAPVLDTLTDREREVVEFAARGLTNREIASRLFVSVRTVHSHLGHAYAKLGVNERGQLAPVVLGRPSRPIAT